VPTSRVVDSAGELEDLRPAWTDLAVANDRPYCTPAWMLSWWANVAPEEPVCG
jgi:CelD/BcsL family acetyltransferase involved in cellulose biosynthesis